jgi:hypothetical protein
VSCIGPIYDVNGLPASWTLVYFRIVVNLFANAKPYNAVKVMIFPVDMMSNIATILSAERSIVLAAMSSFSLTK